MAPFGSHRISPEPTFWSIVNSSSCLPSVRWSRFFASSMLGEMLFEVLLVEERSGVQALQLFAVRVTLPVGAGNAQQFERSADVTGAGHMHAAAEVDELPLAIERNVALRRVRWRYARP